MSFSPDPELVASAKRDLPPELAAEIEGVRGPGVGEELKAELKAYFRLVQQIREVQSEMQVTRNDFGKNPEVAVRLVGLQTQERTKKQNLEAQLGGPDGFKQAVRLFFAELKGEKRRLEERVEDVSQEIKRVREQVKERHSVIAKKEAGIRALYEEVGRLVQKIGSEERELGAMLHEPF